MENKTNKQMKTTLTILLLATTAIAFGQSKQDTVRHVLCRCLIYNEQAHALRHDSTQDQWIKGDSIYRGAFNPFKKKKQ